jgi:hypothetical protein
MQHDYLSPFLEGNNAKQKACKASQYHAKFSYTGFKN